MRFNTIAEGIFDRHEALTRVAVVIIVPLMFGIVAAAFDGLSRIRKK